MAEVELKRTILEKIQKEKEALLNEAKDEEAMILKEAKDRASLLEKEFLKGVEKNCLLIKARRLGGFSLEKEARIQDAKEKKIGLVLSKADKDLKAVTKEKGHYKSIFRFLLEEALAQLSHIERGLKVKVNPSDKEIAQEALKGVKLDIRLETKESIDGGLELCDLDETTIIRNTFSSRLTKLSSELRQEISEILFGS